MATHSVLIAIACLFCLAVAVILLLPDTGNRARLQRRIASMATPEPIIGRGAQTSIVVAARKHSLLDRFLLVFGADLSRRGEHILPWWMVLALSLLGARLAVLVLSFVIGAYSIVAWLPLWAVFSRQAFGWMASRYVEKLRAQMPDALAMIVRAVRVGIPLAESIRAIARECPEPTSAIFGRIAGELAIGLTLEESLRNMTANNAIQEYRFFATALTLQARTGGGLSETLENLSDVMRKRAAAKARGYALAAEARMTVAVLAALPVVALVGMLFLNPAYMDKLFTEQLGHAILAAAVISQAVGMLVMRQMIRSSLS